MEEHRRRQADLDKDTILEAVAKEAAAATRLAILQHERACPVASMQVEHNRMYKEMFNGDDGEHGFFAEVRKALSDLTARARAEDERVKKRWKRSDKLALLAIVATVLIAIGTLVVPTTVVFFKDLYGMAQEYEKLHRSEINQQKSEQQYYNVRIGHQPQLSKE